MSCMDHLGHMVRHSPGCYWSWVLIWVPILMTLTILFKCFNLSSNMLTAIKADSALSKGKKACEDVCLSFYFTLNTSHFISFPVTLYIYHNATGFLLALEHTVVDLYDRADCPD